MNDATRKRLEAAGWRFVPPFECKGDDRFGCWVWTHWDADQGHAIRSEITVSPNGNWGDCVVAFELDLNGYAMGQVAALRAFIEAFEQEGGGKDHTRQGRAD